jgi:hypothetical protein
MSVELVSPVSAREVSPILRDQHVIGHDDVQLQSPANPLSVRPIPAEQVIAENIEVRPLEVFMVSESHATTSGSLVSEAQVA